MGLHSGSNVNGNVLDNTFFDNRVGVMMYTYTAGNRPHENLSFYNNIFFAADKSQTTLSYENDDKPYIEPTLRFDNNYYLRPFDDSYQIQVNIIGENGWRGYSLNTWQQRFGLDLHSKKSPVTFKPYVINSLGSNKFANGNFNSDVSGTYCWNSAYSCVLSWDNTKLDNGALKLSYNVPNGTSENNHLAIQVGEVSSDKKYILRFSFLGSKSTNSAFLVYLRKYNTPYNALTEYQFIVINNSRTEHEFLFDSPSSAPDAAIVFMPLETDGTMWFDNVKMNEADVTLVNPDDVFLFDYNPNKYDKVVPLVGSYIDVAGKPYSGSIILKPFTSIVLIKN